MKNLDKAKLWGWLTVVLFFVWLGFAVPVAMASGDCKGHSCNDGGDTVTDVNVPVNVNTDVSGGPVNVQHKSESLGIGLSNSLGDVDIAGCLGSTQWATPLFSKQKLTVNWPCMAEFYLRNGKPGLAAMAICNTEIRKEFATEQECRQAHDFEVMIEEAVMVFEDSEDEDEELYREIELLKEQVAAQKPPQIIERVVVKDEGAEKRAKARAILDGVKNE